MSLAANLRAFLILGSAVSFVLLSRMPAQAEHNPAAQNEAVVFLSQGRIDEATRVLSSQVATDSHDALAHLLLCRAFYSVELENAAIPECEAAVGNAPSSSNNYLWLGRAYGLKASRANPIAAFRIAKKVVAAFERAVQLDPANAPALSDLGEYYVGAPAIVGGGLDKAQQLSTRIMPVSPTRAHRLLALIAEKKGDLATAEAEFKNAVEAQPSPQSYVDLASFYQRQKKSEQCLAAIQSAIHLDHAKDAALVDAASILTDAKLNSKLAQQLLLDYLASAAKSEGAPAAKVHVQLGDLLLKNGDKTSAAHEYEAALSLASAYAPAQKALRALKPSPAQ